jgi:pyruvate kinase
MASGLQSSRCSGVPDPARSQTKIVATVGPASESESRLRELILAGVDVFRLNTAHGSVGEHQARLDAIRRVSSELGQPIGVLIDLAGPKIRLGELPGGQLQCDAGAAVRFVRGRDPANPHELVTTYEPLVDEVSVGNRIMLADGAVSFVVRALGKDYAACEVVQPGLIRSRQGVNLPGAKLSAPALSEKDKDFAIWAAKGGVDFVGLSFVRGPEEVKNLQSILRAHGSQAQVIAKIEKPEALDRLEEIIEAADGIMVARGDLGVEIDIAQTALVQKRIVDACSRLHKPVIIATQMLDSMQHSRLPTRAEVTDVANAVLDGTDACMLSGETAIGDYPVESVAMMHRIALATEPEVCRRHRPTGPDIPTVGPMPIAEGIVHCAVRAADELGAKLIVVATGTGQVALSLSKNRIAVPTVGVSSSEAVLRRMSLYWGVVPLADVPTDDSRKLLEHVTAYGLAHGLLAPGDRVILIAGTGVGRLAHNAMLVHQLDA